MRNKYLLIIMQNKIIEEFDKLVSEWKEPEFVFERHTVLIDYTSNLIKKARKLLLEAIQSAKKEGYDKGFIDGADQTGRIAEEELAEAKKEAIEECIKLSDEIELQAGKSEFNEWRAFKQFRNTLRDKLNNY